MSGPVDVLAVLRAARDSVPAEQLLDYCAAVAAVAELIEASQAYFAGYCVDEADDDCSTGNGAWTGCTREQHEAARRLRTALARCRGEA